MIVDAAFLDSDRVPPVIIVGSGPAGITLALGLAERGVRSLILEAGGETVTDESQDVYAGRVVGDDYYDLDLSRLRTFGGSSNHWEGWCRPLDEHDFLPRDDLPEYGWPITKAALDPFGPTADDILEIPAVRTRAIGETLLESEFAFSPPVNFAIKYHDTLAASQTTHILFDAPVLSMRAENGRVTSLGIAGRDGARREISPGTVVLCTGGIENSRLLLWSNEVSPEPVVARSETLGRYWMEHPHSYGGQTQVRRGDWRYKSEVTNQFFLAPSYAAMRRYGILNGTVRVWPVYYEEDRARDALKGGICFFGEAGEAVVRRMGEDIVCMPQAQIVWEQEPRAENRVELDTQARDAFGVPRPVLHWKKSALDYRTAKVIFELFGRHVALNDQGVARAYEHLIAEADYPTDPWMAGHHHMGGTRMAEGAGAGVVDRDLRIFGMDNAYVAGSSVFPTGGHANPTYTIVQLSLRLAAHLAERS